MSDLPHPVSIRSFQPEDQPAVKALILSGLVEHWGALDPDRNPDLDDIAASYASAVFLVACRDGEIIGTGALVPRSPTTAEIVRMSVRHDARRQGVGSLILARLLENAMSLGNKKVILETTSTWQEVIEFYLSHGFRITHCQGGDTWFALDLATSRGLS